MEDCKKCCSYEHCVYRKHGESCNYYVILGDWLYTWDGTSGNL